MAGKQELYKMTPERWQSNRTADMYRRILGVSAGFCSGAALMGSFMSDQFESSLLLTILLALTAGWGTLCYQAYGLVRGKVIRLDIWSVLFFLAALVSSGRWIIIPGILGGISFYLLILSWAVSKPDMRLDAGDRLYRFRYPLANLIPLVYIAPEPLSPIFEPAVAIYTTPGAFGLPVWRINIVDPQSLHSYLSSRVNKMSSDDLNWDTLVVNYRSALRILGLLEAISKMEIKSLDGVALAASARLALSNVSDTARLTLIEALMAFNPARRKALLDAFDFIPA